MPGMDEKKDYGTTTRIDISPEMLKNLQPVKRSIHLRPAPGSEAEGPAGKSGSPVLIRIPAQKAPSLEDFHTFIQNLYDAVLITALDGRILSANARAELFFAESRAALCRRNILDLIVGAHASLLDTITTSLGNQRFVLIQAECPRANGSTFPSEISVIHLQITGERHLGFFVRDITVRKENEQRMTTGYNALQNSGSGIAVTEVGGALSGYLNPTMHQLLGLTEGEDYSAVNFRAFLQRPEVGDEIERAMAEGIRWEGELDMKRLDGTEFYAQTAMQPNLNPDGEPIGVVVSLLDVTQQHQAQIQLARYARQLRQRNAEMEADLKMAREVQMAFLPAAYPAVRGTSPGGAQTELHFSHVYHPSGLVGGDFFDLIQVSPSEVLIFMADVMGHGPRAALVVASIRGLIEKITMDTDDAGRFMTELNNNYIRIFGTIGDLMFTTAVCVRINLDKAELQVCHAGHPMPVVQDADGTVRMGQIPEDCMGPAIGLLPDAAYRCKIRPLLPGERILFYTDGITEARNRADEEFGETRILQAFKEHTKKPLAEMLHAVIGSATEFLGANDFEDDVCILGVECSRSAGEQEE